MNKNDFHHLSIQQRINILNDQRAAALKAEHAIGPMHRPDKTDFAIATLHTHAAIMREAGNEDGAENLEAAAEGLIEGAKT